MTNKEKNAECGTVDVASDSPDIIDENESSGDAPTKDQGEKSHNRTETKIDVESNDSDSTGDGDETGGNDESLEEKITGLENSLRGQEEKYLRLMAEFDNFKRRTAREYQQLVERANEKIMLDIIEVRENFERALKSGDSVTELHHFFDGMRMIFDKFETVLQKNGLEVFGECGDEFDPQLHDAMMTSPHPEIPEGKIADVFERGYTLRGNVIKHARVIISSGQPDDQSKQEVPPEMSKKVNANNKPADTSKEPDGTGE